MRTISLRLDTELDKMLQALCDRLGATQTDVVKKALELLASTATPTPAALGVELGLVGTFASGNPRHAEQHSATIRARLAERRRDDERPAVSEAPSRTGNRVAERAPRRPKP